MPPVIRTPNTHASVGHLDPVKTHRSGSASHGHVSTRDSAGGCGPHAMARELLAATEPATPDPFSGVDAFSVPTTPTFAPACKIKELPAPGEQRYQQALAANHIAPMPYSPRQIFNGRGERYVASRAMYAGKFGHVRLAIRSSDHAPVAIKEIPMAGQWHPSHKPKAPHPHLPPTAAGALAGPREATPPAEVAREIDLAREANTAMSPLDTFEHHGRAHVVTRLMEGNCCDLFSRAAMLGQPEFQRDLAIWLMGQVAFEMQSMHDKGLVHRDLKLDNVMRDAWGKLHVADFGYARHLPRDAIMISALVGTAGYIPPEVVSHEQTDHRFDVFSLGVMVASAAMDTMLIGEQHWVDDTMELEAWISDDLPRHIDGVIDTYELQHMTGRWAEVTHKLIAVLGEQTTRFLFDRMLTGTLPHRATMREVFEFANAWSQQDPNIMQRAIAACQIMAESNQSRNQILRALEVFDRMVPCGG